MYLALRVTGNIIWPILLHATTDPSIFLLTAYPGSGSLTPIARPREHRGDHHRARAGRLHPRSGEPEVHRHGSRRFPPDDLPRRNATAHLTVGDTVDYGHALEFGAFITPTAADPETPVALAQIAEASGLDLVTFQDHPYQPAFLDTWTLMTFVAARTDSIRIAPNVLNVPLRPPAVVARSAASLDLLSGGRFDLALGSGGFWDAIEAMGGGRLTAGQAVTALEEAIDVIRELWDTSERRGAFTDGEIPPGARREARPAPRARHPDLDRRVQAAHAVADRAQGRRMAALARVHEARRSAIAATRRSTRPRPRSVAIRARSADC